MAAQTLTDVTRNYDDAAISALLNGEAITLNNSTLNIDSDSRWGQQAAVFGSISISSALGGKINIDARQTKWIRFDASSGNVPALGVAGTNNVTGSIAGVGEFLGVWASLGGEPLAAGVAMPASGFIKLRKSTVAFVDNEVMSFTGGATATIDGAPKVGWIHLVGAELGTFTVPRLGEFVTRGDWFYLDSTNGTDDQNIQFPVADCCPAFQMETSPGSDVYEWWLNAGSRWGSATQFVSTDERGKYFGMVNSTGVITIARRATNACGFKPASGCKIRIPNIICSSSTSANWALNTISATAATRYDFTTTASGSIDIEHLCSNWYLSFTNAYSVKVKDCAQLNYILASNTASTTDLTDIGIGLDLAIDAIPITLTNLFSGANLTGIRAARYQSTVSTGTTLSIVDCDKVILTNCAVEVFGTATTTDRGHASTFSYSLTRVSNSEINNCSAVCGYLNLATTSNLIVKNYKYADKLNGTTTTTIPVNAISLTVSCNNTSFDGVGYLHPSIANLHPYTGWFIISNSNNTSIKNIGTAAAPLDCGSANQTGIFLNATVALNLELRRCYFQNIRTSLFTLTNTVQNVVCDNVWGDGLDTQGIPALNMIVRGTRMTPLLTGQGACYGLHWIEGFNTTTRGQLTVLCNEPLPSTASQATITAGTPKFNSTGSIQMPNVGDQIVWEIPYFIKGHTKLGGAQFTYVSGTLPQNMDYEYQIDTGSGYSTWKMLSTSRVRASGGTAATNTFVFTAVAAGRAPQIGDYVGSILGTNFAPGTTVTNVVGTTITLSSNILVTLTASQQIYFWKDIESEPTINPNTGFKFKIRATTVVAASTNAITTIRVATVTNSIDQQIQYPLPVILNSGKVVGIQAGSRIRVYNSTTGIEIANEIVPGTEWHIDYAEGTSFHDGDVIQIRLAKVVGVNAYLPFSITALASATGWSALATQKLDTVYNTNAIDGSLVTELSGDYPNVQIDSNDADGQTTVQKIYAWFANNQSTEQGIRNFFEAMVAEDLVNYRVQSTLINMKFDNIISTPLMIIGGRIYSDNGSTVIAATSNSIQIDPSKAYAVEVGTSGLTPSEAATLAKLDALTEDSGGLRFKAKALEQAPSGGGGGGSLTAADVWTYGTRSLTTGVPTAAQNASAVRTELATELARVDVATSTRLATSGYTPPTSAPTASQNAAAVRTELATELSRVDVATSTRLATADYTAPTSAPTASQNATAVRAELATELARVDVAVSTRLASSNYTAPANSDIAAVKAKTDSLSFTGANVNSVAKVVEDKDDYTLNSTEVDYLVEAVGVEIERPDGTLAGVKQNTDLIPATL